MNHSKDKEVNGEYYCRICDTSITKWQHEYNNDVCTFCQDELDDLTESGEEVYL